MRRVPLAAALLSLAAIPAVAKGPARESTRAQIDYAGFSQITDDIAEYREGRLLTLEEFQAMARDPNTLILDARSPEAFARGHLEGAVNLTFTDEALREVIGDSNRRILIYCNNNFMNDAAPVVLKRAPMALNIPTFINLYGYGYRNVYELGDVVDFNDPAVNWVRG